MDNLSMTFSSFSKESFKLAVIGNNNAWVDNTTILPRDPLGAQDTQIYSVDNNFIAGEGQADFWCCWWHAATKVRFGVRITMITHIGPAGFQPTWQIMSDVVDDPAAPPTWVASGTEPAASYTWDKSVGFNIVASPKADHSTLNIDIVISDVRS